ncbi:MAG: hypothetical protein FWC68_01505 [Oscillospiraceae bacterium]|nr:hypothetical protein [Oscillospiraceae bacterium]
MNILAISTSSNICSVALLEDNRSIKELNIDSNCSHSENLMPLIKELLDSCSVKLSNIDLIACDNGPRLIYRN